MTDMYHRCTPPHLALLCFIYYTRHLTPYIKKHFHMKRFITQDIDLLGINMHKSINICWMWLNKQQKPLFHIMFLYSLLKTTLFHSDYYIWNMPTAGVIFCYCLWRSEKLFILLNNLRIKINNSWFQMTQNYFSR